MRELWLVAKHEYLKIVKKKSFLLGTLGFPVLIIVVMAISIFVAIGQRGDAPLGYVDLAGVLEAQVMPVLEEGEKMVEFRAYDTEGEAQRALENKEIDAFYILPEDYVQTGNVKLVYLNESPSEVTHDDFSDFLRANLIADKPEMIRRRLFEGPSLVIRAADGSREFETRSPVKFFLPFAAAFFFIFAVMNSGSYMLQAVTDEKENRTIEILTTSLRPVELIGGKALGLMSVGLTQLSLWVFTAVLGLVIAAPFVEQLQGFTVPWSLLIIVALFFIPAYALIAGMMTAIGSAVTDLRQGQQITGIVNMLFTLPFFFVAVIFANPNSPLIVALSLFPTTAFITITLRWSMMVVPLWQLVCSWALLVISAIFSVWVASRVFRMGMLRYGQPLRLKSILTSLRNGQ